MAYKVADRVKETTVVTGTGPATLLGAASGYRSFASQLSIGDTCAYAIVNANASEWEVGIGTYSAVNTLTRTTVHASTNSNAAVVFTAGTKDVFLSPTAETVLSDVTSTDGTVTLTKTGSIVDLSVAVAAATTNVIVQVRNNTGATLTKGTVVYINNAIGQIPTVAKALATSDATSAQTLGMVSADINDNANGYVTIIGLINDINTGSYLDGDQLYLSGTTAGTFTKVKPYAPTHLVYVGVVEYAHSVHGKIFVKVQNGYEMDELHNVDAYNPSNGDLLIYNTSTNLWTHSPQSSLTVAPSQVTGTAVITSDSRLSDSRTPTGSAGGVLAGTYPNPSFASTTGSGSVVLSTAPTLVTPQTNTINAVPVVSGAGNSLTIAAGSGVGTGAGGSLVLQAGIQATSGGDGKVVVKQVAGQTSNLQEWQDSSGTVIGAINVNGNIITKLGTLLDGCIFVYSGSATNGDVIFGTKLSNGTPKYLCGFSGVTIKNDAYYRWSSGNDAISTADLYLYRDAAGTLAQRNGTSPQSFRIYNTYTDASNYERLGITWATNVCTISPENAGTGTARGLSIQSGTGLPVYCGSSLQLQSGSLVFRWYNGSTIGVGPSFSDIYFTNPNNFVSVRNGTAGQKFGVYNTFTDVSNYERLAATWASNICTIGLEQAGTGLPRTLNVNANALNAPSLPSAATVTAATGNGTTVTYTCASTFAIGQVVSITGLTPTTGASLNLSNQTITGVTATTFTVANTTVGTAAATQAGTATIQSAGNSVTITAGSGSGVGAGGNIILQPGAQGTSGGNGKVRINDTAGVDTGFNFTRGYAGYPTLDQNRVYLRSATDNNQVIEFRSDAGAGNINIGPTGSVLSLGNGSNYVGIKEKSNSGTVSVISGSYTGTTGSSFAFPNATTAIAANTNDLALPASAFQRLNCTSPCSLTGIAPVTGTGSVHVDGRMIRVYNVGNANLTLAHNSTSTTGNKFYNATGADIILAPNDYAELIYDSTNNGSGNAGWRVA